MRTLVRAALAFLAGTDAPPGRRPPAPHLHFDRDRRSWVPCQASRTHRRAHRS
ncbi:MAG TPA: hypothetical protein VFD01_13035 [Candidatus Dormibacteraeota bacterium]|nr:hypothetical protein [Candidatus Dormibacteraeota bacterium]